MTDRRGTLRCVSASFKTILWASIATLSSSLAQQPNPTSTVSPGTIGPDGAYRVGNGVTSAAPLTRVPGTLPDLARQLRASGEVTLSVVVGENGDIRDVRVIKSAGYGMDARAMEAVRKWRFRAGTKDGKPVDVRIQVAFNFGVTPELNSWGAGPLLFDVDPGVKPPTLRSGSMPKAVRQRGDETVVLQFAVNTDGEVSDVQVVQGKIPSRCRYSSPAFRNGDLSLLQMEHLSPCDLQGTADQRRGSISIPGRIGFS